MYLQKNLFGDQEYLHEDINTILFIAVIPPVEIPITTQPKILKR